MSTRRRRKAESLPNRLCEVCGIGFASKYNKNRHLYTVHGIQIEEKKNVELNIECNLCQLKFAKKKYLLRHQRSFHSKRGIVNQLTLFGLSEYKSLKNSLPPRTDYELLQFDPNFFEIGGWYTAKLKFWCPDEANLIMWKEEYEALNQLVLRLDNESDPEMPEALFQVSFKCNYSLIRTRTTAPRLKEPCPASLSLILVEENENVNKALIFIKNTHNHVRNYLSVSNDLKEKFILMFHSKRNVAQAIAIHRDDMLYDYGDDLYLISEDLSFFQKQRWIYLLYRNVMKIEIAQKREMMDSLYKAVTDYNRSVKQTAAHFQILSDNFIIVIFNPFMQRVSKIKEAEEIMFINTSSDVERYNCKAFLFLVHTAAGSFPVGSLITTSDSEYIMTTALEMYKKMLTPNSFGGRGSKGPKLIMTNDSTAERDSLAVIFNESNYLVSSFNVLQTMWQYIWDPAAGIHELHQQDLFEWIKRMVYAETESELDEIFKHFYADSIIQNYPNFIDYMSKLYDEKNEWALCTKKDLILEERSASNICDMAAIIAKDRNLDHIKAFSPLQLFDFIVNDLTLFYEMKLLEAVAGYPYAYIKRKYEYVLKNSINMTWGKIDGTEHTYEIVNDNGYTYVIDAQVALCSCSTGITGAYCKHLFYLSQHINIPLLNEIPENLEENASLHYIITNTNEIESEACITLWFNTERSSNLKENIAKINSYSSEDDLSNSDDDINDENYKTHEESTSNITSQLEPQRLESTLSNFKNAFQEIVAKCAHNSFFLSGLQSFITSYNTTCNDDAALFSSLYSFGKVYDVQTKTELNDLMEDESQQSFNVIPFEEIE